MSKLEFDSKTLNELVTGFVNTPLGKYYLQELVEQYQRLHDDAEASESVEQKALLVERARGLRSAIKWLTTRVKDDQPEVLKPEDAVVVPS